MDTLAGQNLDVFLESAAPLRGSNAAAALIQDAYGNYLLQLRDNLPAIWFPNHWGLFGGAVEAGEAPKSALLRELTEELGLEISAERLTYFTAFDFDFGSFGQSKIYRQFYSLQLKHDELVSIRLGEGREARTFSFPEIMEKLKVAPYDSFAIWLSHSRNRLK